MDTACCSPSHAFLAKLIVRITLSLLHATLQATRSPVSESLCHCCNQACCRAASAESSLASRCANKLWASCESPIGSTLCRALPNCRMSDRVVYLPSSRFSSSQFVKLSNSSGRAASASANVSRSMSMHGSGPSCTMLSHLGSLCTREFLCSISRASHTSLAQFWASCEHPKRPSK